MLIALIFPRELQLLSNIRISDIQTDNESIKISFPNEEDLVIRNFEKNPRLCVASTIRHYMNRTRHLGNPREKLFISSKKPHSSASSETINNWLGKIFENVFGRRVNINIMKETVLWTDTPEIIAIREALRRSQTIENSKIVIFSDCRSALEAIKFASPQIKNKYEITDILKLNQHSQNNNKQINLAWKAGHNEISP
ncbi:hypothetical protein JTB14_019809 [Gonioctena quinquepunctata]|nr:hypothetical protein JTB14_019809 [Gonioctena quinquepunctata]